MPTSTEMVLSRLSPALPSWRSTSDMDLAFGSVVDDHTGSMQILCTLGTRTRVLDHLEITPGTGLGGKALALSRPTSVGNYETARGITHHYDHAVRSEAMVTTAAVPIIVTGRARAVVYLGSTSELTLGDRWFDTLDPLRRRLQHEILVEDEVQARLVQLEAAQASLRPDPSAAELASVARELGEVAAELGTFDISAKLDRIRQRLDGGAAVEHGVTLPDGSGLTRRELQVLVEAARGLSNRQIAANLGLLPNTVKSYFQDLLRKLDCANRVQAIAFARRAGWID